MEMEEGKLYYVSGEGFAARCTMYNGRAHRVGYHIEWGEDGKSNVVHGSLTLLKREIEGVRLVEKVEQEEMDILDALRAKNLDQSGVKVEVGR